MKDLIVKNINEIEPIKVKGNGGKSEFFAKPVVPYEDIASCSCAVIEVSVGQQSYSHHWHERTEEIFYIISGVGKLRHYDGERQVRAGDVLCFPTGEKGVHSIANASDSEPLIYLDIATNRPKVDIAMLPDTNQVIFYGEHVKETILDMPK